MSNIDMNGQSTQQQYSNNNNNNANNNNANNNNANNANANNANASNANANNANASNANANNANANNANNNNANNNNNGSTNSNNNSNSNNGDKSILQQVATQERRIAELNKSLADRNQTLAKFQTEKKSEMEALMSGMRQWIGNLDVKNEGHKDEFEKGLQRLVDTSSFDNGVWNVMVSASACAAKKEEDYQALKTQYEELNQQKDGGIFGNADARVGNKRMATGEPDTCNDAVADIWSNFIADVATSGYPSH
jgi:hypothetical protein